MLPVAVTDLEEKSSFRRLNRGTAQVRSQESASAARTGLPDVRAPSRMLPMSSVMQVWLRADLRTFPEWA